MTAQRQLELTTSGKFVHLNVSNDSNLLAIYTEQAGKKAAAVRSAKDAADRELGFVLPLVQDDSYVLRVRLGQPSATEKRECVGFSSGHLDLSSGILVSGESSVRVPGKRFRVEVRSFLPHSTACWQLAKSNRRSEKLGAYYRRTRPGQPFPEWLREICWSHPGDDPGYEKEWRQFSVMDAPKNAYVDFLVCLLRPSTSKPLSKVNRNGIATWEIRCPEICPRGIKAPGISPEEMK